MKTTVIESINTRQHTNTNIKKQQGISDAILKLSELRKELKMKDLADSESFTLYVFLSKDIQRGCCKDKDNYYNICKEIKEHASRNGNKDLFKKSK